MNKKNEQYNMDFWNYVKERNYNSAKIILNMLFEYYKPTSMIDIGCGIGMWLKAAQELNISKFKGLDFNEIEEDSLMLPRKYIDIVDLEKHKNINNDNYDLAVSLEVGEHLGYEHSSNFVNMITSYSKIVLFSAAIPYQAGIDHINCQPPFFWSELFKNNGYICFDPFRYRLMELSEPIMSPFYSQNILLYVHESMQNIFSNKELKKYDKPIFFYHPVVINHLDFQKNELINELNKEIDDYKHAIEKYRLKINWFTLFGISNNSEYFRITFLGIKFTFKVDYKSINRIAWWIPIRKWRNNFRSRFAIVDQTRPDQTRPDQTRPDQTRPVYSDYICFYHNLKYKKLQAWLQYEITA